MNIDNNVGVIYDNILQLKSNNLSLKIQEIATIKLRKGTATDFVKLLAMILICGVIFYFFGNVLLVTGYLLVMFIFRKQLLQKKRFFIQIVLCEVKQIRIRIEKQQLHEAKMLVHKVAEIRQKNSDF